MIVCVCRRVSDRDIQRAARDGAASFDDLQDQLGVATACGACLDCARDTWAQACCGSAASGKGARAAAPTTSGRRAVVVLHPPRAAAYPG